MSDEHVIRWRSADLDTDLAVDTDGRLLIWIDYPGCRDPRWIESSTDGAERDARRLLTAEVSRLRAALEAARDCDGDADDYEAIFERALTTPPAAMAEEVPPRAVDEQADVEVVP